MEPLDPLWPRDLEHPWDLGAVVATAAGQPKDDQPCTFCQGADRQQEMILCNKCNACYHPDCAKGTGGSQVHEGPWFCEACKGELTLSGIQDISQDWPLIDHLWTSWLPEDISEANQIC